MIHEAVGCVIQDFFSSSPDAGPGVTDTLIMKLHVEGLQEAVTIGSSFAVAGDMGRGWNEALKLPEAVPGSGYVRLQAGVGRMPVILSLADQIYEANPEWVSLQQLQLHVQKFHTCFLQVR